MNEGIAGEASASPAPPRLEEIVDVFVPAPPRALSDRLSDLAWEIEQALDGKRNHWRVSDPAMVREAVAIVRASEQAPADVPCAP